MLISQKADAFNRNGYCTSTNKHTLSLSMDSRDHHGRKHQINVDLPYWVTWSDGSAQLISFPEAQRRLQQANPSRCRNADNVPVVHAESDLFRGVVFAPGSLGATLSQSGALKFIAEQHAGGNLFDLRNHVVPMGLVLPPSSMRMFTELFHDILKIADAFPDKSEPQMVMAAIAQLLNHFVYARGAYLSQIEECMTEFRQGKLDKLWAFKKKTAAKLQAKHERDPTSDRPMTDKQKDKAAKRLAQHGNCPKPIR